MATMELSENALPALCRNLARAWHGGRGGAPCKRLQGERAATSAQDRGRGRSSLGDGPVDFCDSRRRWLLGRSRCPAADRGFGGGAGGGGRADFETARGPSHRGPAARHGVPAVVVRARPCREHALLRAPAPWVMGVTNSRQEWASAVRPSDRRRRSSRTRSAADAPLRPSFRPELSIAATQSANDIVLAMSLALSSRSRSERAMRSLFPRL